MVSQVSYSDVMDFDGWTPFSSRRKKVSRRIKQDDASLLVSQEVKGFSGLK